MLFRKNIHHIYIHIYMYIHQLHITGKKLTKNPSMLWCVGVFYHYCTLFHFIWVVVTSFFVCFLYLLKIFFFFYLTTSLTLVYISLWMWMNKKCFCSFCDNYYLIILFCYFLKKKKINKTTELSIGEKQGKSDQRRCTNIGHSNSTIWNLLKKEETTSVMSNIHITGPPR